MGAKTRKEMTKRWSMLKKTDRLRIRNAVLAARKGYEKLVHTKRTKSRVNECSTIGAGVTV